MSRTLRVPGRLGNTARVDSRARVDVGAHFLVDVDQNARVGVLVDAREEHSARGRRAAAAHGDLVAGGVELGLVERAGGVQGEDFGAEEIVAGGDVGGDLYVDCEGRLVCWGEAWEGD